jgi:hypothetical protein
MHGLSTGSIARDAGGVDSVVKGTVVDVVDIADIQEIDVGLHSTAADVTLMACPCPSKPPGIGAIDRPGEELVTDPHHPHDHRPA